MGKTIFLVGAALLAAPAASAKPTAAPACATKDLVVWLDTAAGAAAGSAYYKLEFTNLSSHTCRLTGYPGVSAIDLRGRRLGSAAGRNSTQVTIAVAVASGRTVTAVLQIADAENFPRAACQQQTAAGLRVFPPGQRAAKVVPFPFRACSRRGPVYLRVQAVRAA